ncbi:inositol monophosphatase [Marinicella sp. S1101]|uniref:inositol monophosphatase family protein n=1 Tax=Marinicella marina TaxID=2996016 RepID=UPI002260C4F5|nr:inositol monophosphatase [Marinicella marina]MCX7553452.1 inositol monophosphatase [Marinicella marina]MDJ1140076.1 inositol monophosphatase [Marinicella marina]
MTNKPTLDPEFLTAALDVAQKAAKKAETVIKKYYQGGELSTEVKGDLTPVTVADKACEKVIREAISEAFPGHGIFGEEFGRSDNEDSDYLWLIDPIDGTKSFVREYPFFSTQIALMYRDEIVMGVSNAPVFGEMAWATFGGGAFLNGNKINVSDEFLAHSSCVSTGNIQTLINNNWQRLGQLLAKFSKIRGYGDFYHYHLLAAGKIDLIVESDVNILDIAALSLIVKESGGVISDLSGKPINLDTTSILAGTTKTHALGLELLNE